MHRGFGFAVFTDADAVDRLLQGARSRFLPLADAGGHLLEVQRAESKAIQAFRSAHLPTPCAFQCPRRARKLWDAAGTPAKLRIEQGEVIVAFE